MDEFSLDTLGRKIEKLTVKIKKGDMPMFEALSKLEIFRRQFYKVSDVYSVKLDCDINVFLNYHNAKTKQDITEESRNHIKAISNLAAVQIHKILEESELKLEKAIYFKHGFPVLDLKGTTWKVFKDTFKYDCFVSYNYIDKTMIAIIESLEDLMMNYFLTLDTETFFWDGFPLGIKELRRDFLMNFKKSLESLSGI